MVKPETAAKSQKSRGLDEERRYTSIKIGEKTLKRFEKSGTTYIHRATSTLFKRVGDKLKSVSAQGITKKEYCKSYRPKTS